MVTVTKHIVILFKTYKILKIRFFSAQTGYGTKLSASGFFKPMKASWVKHHSIIYPPTVAFIVMTLAKENCLCLRGAIKKQTNNKKCVILESELYAGNGVV